MQGGRRGKKTTQSQSQAGSAEQQPREKNPVPGVENEAPIGDIEAPERQQVIVPRRPSENPYRGAPLPDFEEWKEETDAYIPADYNPYTGHVWGYKYNPENDYRYDRRRANMDIEQIMSHEGFKDMRNNKDESLRKMTETQKADLNQLIDVTINKKRDLKFNPNLLSLQYADKYARSKGGWAQKIDVTPYDKRDEDEIVVFNKYGIPTHINGYSWGRSDAGVQQMYQEQYPGGYDPARKQYIPYSQWKREQFDVTKREKPWEPIRVKSANTELFDQLRGRGYNPPKAPAEALPITSIWNKIVSKRIRNWLNDEIEFFIDENGHLDEGISEEDLQKFRQYVIIRDGVSLIQLSSLLFKYYIDAHFWQLILKANVLPEKDIPKNFKEYKKLINQKDGKVNRAQYRRMFYNVFIEPPNSFRWNDESTKRAIEQADVSSDGKSLSEVVDEFMAKNGEIVTSYFQALMDIDLAENAESLTQDLRLKLAEDKKTKAYCQKTMKTYFSDKLKEWNTAFENAMIKQENGEWDQSSWDLPEFGDLIILSKPLYNKEKEDYWNVQLPNPDKPTETIPFNMAEIPEKGKGKK